jgi:hypothetical protein
MSNPSEGTSTLFQARPVKRFKINAREIARDLTPPLLWRIASRALGSSRAYAEVPITSIDPPFAWAGRP